MGSLELATEWFGTFLYEDGDLETKRRFPPEPEAIADRLEKIREGELLYEEEELADLVDEGDELLVPDRRLAKLPGAHKTELAHRRQDPADHGTDPELRRQAAMLLVERSVEGALSEQSRHLVQAVAYLDESHEMQNQMGERLVSWFQLHAPEVVERTGGHLELARLIVDHGTGDEISDAMGWPKGIGSPLGDAEQDAIQGLARAIVEQHSSREPLESFIEDVAMEIAPNITELTTPSIAARLIHHAGGLRELAKQPASTIQMLGAETAVFNHLVEGAPPPKHGVIYQHPMIYKAHPNDRGSISRAMAAKIAIAARADAFTGNHIAGELKAELEARAEEVARVGKRRAMKNKGGS